MTTALGCASTRTPEGAGEYVDDIITTKVKAAIFNERGLKVSEIKVETFKNGTPETAVYNPWWHGWDQQTKEPYVRLRTDVPAAPAHTRPSDG